MKIKALKKFRDKETKEIYKKRKIINFKKDRSKDCINRGLAEEFKTEKKEEKPVTKKKEGDPVGKAPKKDKED